MANINDTKTLTYEASVGSCSCCGEAIIAKFTAKMVISTNSKPTFMHNWNIGGAALAQLVPSFMSVHHECSGTSININNTGEEELPKAAVFHPEELRGLDPTEEATPVDRSNRYPAELWCSISYPVEEGYNQTKWDHFKDGVYHLRKDKVDAATVEADFDSLVRSTPYAVDPSSNYNYSLMGKKDEETRRGELGAQA